jgi:hypothetical protein
LCNDTSHGADENTYADQIIRACVLATSEAILTTCARNPSRVYEFVEPVRQKSPLWHQMSLDCGRPRSGHVTYIMRRTHAKYNSAVRRVERDENIIVRQRFADSMLCSGNRHFWSEAKKLAGQHGACAKVIDNKYDANETGSFFVQKYSEL